MDFCAIHSRGRKDRGVQLKCCLSQSNSSRRLLDNTPLLARAPGQITGRGNYGGLAAGGSSSSNSTTKNVVKIKDKRVWGALSLRLGRSLFRSGFRFHFLGFWVCSLLFTSCHHLRVSCPRMPRLTAGGGGAGAVAVFHV